MLSSSNISISKIHSKPSQINQIPHTPISLPQLGQANKQVHFFFAGWLACWLAGWLACWLAGLLARWLDGWLAGWLRPFFSWLAGLDFLFRGWLRFLFEHRWGNKNRGISSPVQGQADLHRRENSQGISPWVEGDMGNPGLGWLRLVVRGWLRFLLNTGGHNSQGIFSPVQGQADLHQWSQGCTLHQNIAPIPP